MARPLKKRSVSIRRHLAGITEKWAGGNGSHVNPETENCPLNPADGLPHACLGEDSWHTWLLRRQANAVQNTEPSYRPLEGGNQDCDDFSRFRAAWGWELLEKPFAPWSPEIRPQSHKAPTHVVAGGLWGSPCPRGEDLKCRPVGRSSQTAGRWCLWPVFREMPGSLADFSRESTVEAVFHEAGLFLGLQNCTDGRRAPRYLWHWSREGAGAWEGTPRRVRPTPKTRFLSQRN